MHSLTATLLIFSIRAVLISITLKSGRNALAIQTLETSGSTRYRNNRIQQIKYVSRRTYCGFFIVIVINVKLTTKTCKHQRIIRKVCILEKKYKSFHAFTYGNPAHLLHSCSPHLHHIEIRTECTGHSNTGNFRKHTLSHLQNIGIIASSRSSMLVVELIVFSSF